MCIRDRWLICLILGHFLGGIGQPIAIHRYFSHRAFKTNKFWHYFLMYTAVISAAGSTILYKAAHIKHHRYADKEGDPHSPKYDGLFKVFFGFFFQNEKNKMNMRFVKFSDPINSVLRSVEIDRTWFKSEICTRNEINGSWPCQQLDTGTQEQAQFERSASFTKYKQPMKHKIARSLLHVRFDLPYPVAGNLSRHY